jgi:hypothetical protein
MCWGEGIGTGLSTMSACSGLRVSRASRPAILPKCHREYRCEVSGSDVSPCLAGQAEMANSKMKEFVDLNYAYLNGNVEAMGKILRKFNETFRDVKNLRSEVSL